MQPEFEIIGFGSADVEAGALEFRCVRPRICMHGTYTTYDDECVEEWAATLSNALAAEDKMYVFPVSQENSEKKYPFP